MSACIADRLSTVSRRVSPLVEEDAAMFRLMTSAERRLAAISKVVRVRVDGSKNRLKIGGLQDLQDHFARQPLDGEQVLQRAVAVKLWVSHPRASG
jgi:hypothetical protein